MKRSIMRVFLFIEIIVFLGMYTMGPQGIQVFWQLKDENLTIEHAIALVRLEIEQLEQRVVACKSDSFYKERIAREQLQMARKGDVIYYVG